MNITRNNYEEFFMLYADNELPAAERKLVEAFVAVNPDLQQELISFQQFKLIPDEAIVFDNKSALLKQQEAAAGDTITLANCESFFVLYADNELTGTEKTAVEAFVYHNPGVQQSFELVQQVKLQADNAIVFENKESLYRYEKDDKVVPFRWWRMAAAAAVLLLIAGTVWFKNTDPLNQIAVNTGKPVGKSTVQQTASQKAIDNTITVDSNEQRGKAAIAATNIKQPFKAKTQIPVVAAVKKTIMKHDQPLPAGQGLISPEEVVTTNKHVTNGTINPVAVPSRKVEVKETLIAAANKLLPDQPSIILNPDENNKAEFASLTNDNVEVLNTSVNTKSSLRGFLRKASRLIAKKTNSGNDDHKGILIGGFEIAVR